MNQAAPRPCTSPGCGVLVRDGSGRCQRHPKLSGFADKRRGTRHERGYGTAWDKLRASIMRRDAGLCQPSLRAGFVVAAVAVDHITSKANGGTDDPSNLQAISKAAHDAKTAAERRGNRWDETVWAKTLYF